MTLAELLERLPIAGLDGLAFPRRLLGAFRRKSITFCTGTTDETTIVYWFQSRTFTIDLRLPDGAATPVPERQGWVGDTLWDDATRQLSWNIGRNYQPCNQWPEPASLRFIGNSVLEFAPSGAYVEDWRQQPSRGTLLGLRLVSMLNETSGQRFPMAGGLILAGEYAAYAQSRLPALDDALQGAVSLEQARAEGIVTDREIESYEVSIATDGAAITHSTRPDRLGQAVAAGDFRLGPDGIITLSKIIDGRSYRLHFVLDLHLPDFIFDHQTTSTLEAQAWMAREKGHLARHAVIAR
ncbi:hypothetical protein OK349_14570 [Sphingomonas sp. BT-65]|uniref:hypothetical protein n=1 Tax=Sphingomonas sp. BT-65 TaxID=2989821 RepID=UPI0022368A3B|nr:hypothetical protein [Sphingomonas sp. BT-65]MCW4462936.1 hypothetical protein [Sphingomonas sp. BT-65]